MRCVEMMGQSQQLMLMTKALMLGTASFVSLGLGLGWATPVLGNEEVEALGSEGVEELGSNEIASPLPESPTGRLRQHPIDELYLDEVETPATTVAEWMAQIEASQVQITGVRLEPTETGLSIVLETPEGDLPTPTTQTVGNALTADIPNAVLALPEGEMFEQFGPVEGIALVSVMNLPDGGVRVSITGTDAPPQAEVNTEAGNLVLSVAPGVAAAAAPGDDDAIQVVVTATRTEEEIQDVPRSVTVITREELEQQLSVNRNLGDVLGRLVPGFGPPNGIGSSIDFQSLRGRAASVLIDGVPISENVGLGRELRSLDPAAIERIEIVRGPTALYGGEATGGVINIITRQPSNERLSLTSEVGGVLSLTGGEDKWSSLLRQTVSGREGIFSYDFTAAAEFNGGIFDANGDRVFVLAGDGSLSDADTVNLFGKIRFDFDENQRLQLTANYFNDRREAFILDPAVAATPGTQAARAIRLDDIDIDGGLPERNNTLLNLSYAHADVLGGELQAQAYYRYYDENGAIPNDERGNPLFDKIIRTQWNWEQWGGRLQLNTPLAETLSLLWGADFARERSEQPFDIFDPVAFDSSDGRTFRRIDTGTFVPPSVLDELGLFTQLQWQPTERWQLSGGVRYENISFSVDDYTTSNGQPIQGGNLNFDDFAFNVGTVFDATDNISLFASLAQGFSVPAFGRVLRVPPTGFEQVTDALDVTQPQKVTEYEIGVRGDWDGVQASLAAFYNTSDLGTFFEQGVGGVFVPVRAPERIYGVEATVDTQVSEVWRLGGSFSWSEGENDPLEDGNFVALSSATIQPFKLSAYVENETLPGWTNRLQVLWVGSRDRAFAADVDLVPIGSYAVVDYISSITVGSGVIQIGIENLFNTQYFPVASQFLAGFDEQFNVAGRGRTVSLRYQVDW